MKSFIRGILPALALLLATSAFAATKGSFEVFEPVTVNGHQLKPGIYQAVWEGVGPVEVSILSNGKVVTTSPARLVELNQGGENNSIEFSKDSDGTNALREIDFLGKKYKLALGTEQPADGSAAAGNQ
jgi:hypothetical protein